MKKKKTYMDKLMQDKDFREKFDVEYQKLCAEEKKAKVKSDTTLLSQPIKNN